MGDTGAAARGDRIVSGNGWVDCACGARHWGRYGAAGLLLHAPNASPGTNANANDDADQQRNTSGRDGPDGPGQVLLQHRALWSHEGGTWGLPGGARDEGETARDAAVREAGEEAGVPSSAVRPIGQLLVDHGTWSYTTVVARAVAAVEAAATDAESLELRWVPVDAVTDLPLHSGLAAAWPLLRRALTAPPLTLVVDGANVVGSRPDGWWRDRAGAAARLRDQLRTLLDTPVAAAALPASATGLPRAELTGWYAEPVLVVEGQARSLPDDLQGVAVVRADGSGDEAIEAEVAARLAGGDEVLAVTADRELARRTRAAGAAVVGPRWLRAVLELP